MNIYYDFHIHSCLSPCGDDDNTPNNIVNMALIKGLNAIALSDHNTGKNCPATIAAGKKNGLVVLPAMELTTSEDIHVLCLFEKYEQLAALEEYIAPRRMCISTWSTATCLPNCFVKPLVFNNISLLPSLIFILSVLSLVLHRLS